MSRCGITLRGVREKIQSQTFVLDDYNKAKCLLEGVGSAVFAQAVMGILKDVVNRVAKGGALDTPVEELLAEMAKLSFKKRLLNHLRRMTKYDDFFRKVVATLYDNGLGQLAFHLVPNRFIEEKIPVSTVSLEEETRRFAERKRLERQKREERARMSSQKRQMEIARLERRNNEINSITFGINRIATPVWALGLKAEYERNIKRIRELKSSITRRH